MERYFEVAFRVQDGKRVQAVVDEKGTTADVRWNVAPEDMPAYATANAAGADFKAAEDVTVPSIWRAVFSCLAAQGKSVAGWVEGLVKNGGKSDISISDELKESQKKAFAPTLIHTGIKAKMPEDEVLTIYNRSSGPKKLGLILANSAGIIDADYYGCDATDGEIMFAYYNIFPFDVNIHKGEAIGQGVFTKVLRAENARIGDKRVGGFGSTDAK